MRLEINRVGHAYEALEVLDDISLTIDSEIQTISAEMLKGHKGSVIVMDMESGEILSMVSSPSFNPNMFSDSNYSKRLAGLSKAGGSPFLNRSISGVYPPGSVFKVITAIGALDSKKTTQYTPFHCIGNSA